jgi:hypothetical protein
MPELIPIPIGEHRVCAARTNKDPSVVSYDPQSWKLAGKTIRVCNETWTWGIKSIEVIASARHTYERGQLVHVAKGKWIMKEWFEESSILSGTSGKLGSSILGPLDIKSLTKSRRKSKHEIDQMIQKTSEVN